jgi:hypothetical protein
MAALLFIIAFFCSTEVYRISKDSIGAGKLLVLFFISMTIIFGGIRWERGTDWQPYYRFFERYKTWEYFSKGEFEILYAFLNYIVKYIANSYTVFLLVLSFFVITISYKVIKRLAVFPLLSYYLYFCTNIGGMFPVRQSLAIAIVLTSIYFIHKRNKFVFLFIVFFSSMFHASMLVWLIAYPIYHIKKLKSFQIILLFITTSVLGILGKVFLIPILELVLSPFGSTGYIVTRLMGYATGNYSDDSYTILGMFLSISKRMIFIPIFLVLRKKLVSINKYLSGLLNLYFAGNILYMLFVFNEAFGPLNRMTTPFLFIEVLILPPIISILKQSYLKYIFLYILFFYGLLKLYTALNTYPDAYIPYKSIF